MGSSTWIRAARVCIFTHCALTVFAAREGAVSGNGACDVAAWRRCLPRRWFLRSAGWFRRRW
eukprot:13887533-Alexandrium_andersonii.AAC.1